MNTGIYIEIEANEIKNRLLMAAASLDSGEASRVTLFFEPDGFEQIRETFLPAYIDRYFTIIRYGKDASGDVKHVGVALCATKCYGDDVPNPTILYTQYEN